MITKTIGYAASDGIVYAELDRAKKSELALLLAQAGHAPSAEIADTLITYSDKIVDILTTGPKSRPSRRKVNGGRRKSKRHEAEQFRFPFTTEAAPQSEVAQ